MFSQTMKRVQPDQAAADGQVMSAKAVGQGHTDATVTACDTTTSGSAGDLSQTDDITDHERSVLGEDGEEEGSDVIVEVANGSDDECEKFGLESKSHDDNADVEFPVRRAGSPRLPSKRRRCSGGDRMDNLIDPRQRDNQYYLPQQHQHNTHNGRHNIYRPYEPQRKDCASTKDNNTQTKFSTGQREKTQIYKQGHEQDRLRQRKQNHPQDKRYRQHQQQQQQMHNKNYQFSHRHSASELKEKPRRPPVANSAFTCISRSDSPHSLRDTHLDHPAESDEDKALFRDADMQLCLAAGDGVYGRHAEHDGRHDNDDLKHTSLFGSRSKVPEEVRLRINSRERQRMHDLNSALDSLRQVMPYSSGPSVKKLSKMSTLLLARNYIVMLSRSLEEMRRLVQELSLTQRLHRPTVPAASTIPQPPTASSLPVTPSLPSLPLPPPLPPPTSSPRSFQSVHAMPSPPPAPRKLPTQPSPAKPTPSTSSSPSSPPSPVTATRTTTASLAANSLPPQEPALIAPSPAQLRQLPEPATLYASLLTSHGGVTSGVQLLPPGYLHTTPLAPPPPPPPSLVMQPHSPHFHHPGHQYQHALAGLMACACVSCLKQKISPPSSTT